MKLFVARHHYAGDPNDDPKKEIERALWPEGKAAALAVATALLKKGDIPSCIFSSPYQRAIGTAFIYGKKLVANVAIIGDLAPIRPLANGLFSLIKAREKIGRVMIVGHRDNIEPLFRDLDGPKFPDIAMGEIRRLDIDRKTGAWSLRWAIKASDVGFKDYYS